MTPRNAISRLALALATTTAALACSAPAEGASVFVTGSSTVEPISVRVAELLEDEGAALLVDIEGPGTGDGFEKFCNGDAQITDASRAIKAEEIATCEGNGVDFIELEVAFDGLSVLTSPANRTVDCLGFADLYALVGPEAEGSDTWAEAGRLARELGSSTKLPRRPLEITGPGEESGTYDSFVEIVLSDVADARVETGAITEAEAETTRPDYSSQGDDNAILQGVAGAEGSLGWVGFAFAQEAGDTVKQLAIDGGDGCVAPSVETIADGSYPISRPLFVYVNASAAEELPGVATYVDFYLDGGASAVAEVGYVPLPDDQWQQTVDIWTARTTGSREGREQ